MKLWLGLLIALPVFAQDAGTLNPMEMAIGDAADSQPSIATCTSGYYLVKGGDHAPGFRVHEKCAAAGYTRSMLWLSYMYQNGYHVEEDPALAAYWDAEAAFSGNEVGMLNFGIDLLRGYGVGQYVVAGQYWVNRAADLGHKRAIELREANYDLRVVTPDVDEEKFRKSSNLD